MAKVYQNVDEDIKKQAENLNKTNNISPIDALHLASAESSNTELFITCDYAIIKKYKGKLKVINPLGFLTYYGNAN